MLAMLCKSNVKDEDGIVTLSVPFYVCVKHAQQHFPSDKLAFFSDMADN